MRHKRAVRKMIADVAAEHGVRFSDVETALILDRSLAMERLVRWLALSFRVVSYEDDGTERVTWNTPTFPHAYPWGEEMPEAQEMARIFHEIVGPPTEVKELK